MNSNLVARRRNGFLTFVYLSDECSAECMRDFSEGASLRCRKNKSLFERADNGIMKLVFFSPSPRLTLMKYWEQTTYRQWPKEFKMKRIASFCCVKYDDSLKSSKQVFLHTYVNISQQIKGVNLRHNNGSRWLKKNKKLLIQLNSLLSSRCFRLAGFNARSYVNK